MAASLHQRLIGILLGLNFVAWILSLGLTAIFAQKIIVEQIDRQLNHHMDVVMHTMGPIFSEPEINAHFRNNTKWISSEPGVSRVRGYSGQGREEGTNLWFGKAQVLVGDYTPAFPAPEGEGVIRHTLGEGAEASTWRILYRRYNQTRIWVAVGVDLAFSPDIGDTTIFRVILPLLVIMPLTLIILLWGVGRGLRPLGSLATKIATRMPQALDPINPEGVPREIQPVVTSINNLMGRLHRALASEQRFTSNAAHELQTPLAAIKAEVQRCQRLVTDPASQHMLERIAARVSRAADTVAQLLILARLDPEQEFPHVRTELKELVLDVIAEEGETAVERDIDIQIKGNASVFVEGHPEWLRILLRNLLVNAFKYSPVGGVVEVNIDRQRGSGRLVISNDCEPISDQQRQRMMDRFYSIPGREGSGVGLGLSIVSRIADLHKATLRLDKWSGERGCIVEILFPEI